MPAQTRKLAAIMFTDIEGYTALMQGNETQAIKLREGHRSIFKTTTDKHQGKILQYYGDGTLSIFDSAIEAVQCAIEMQLAFRMIEIPVRIGIHTGDIIHSEEDIIGDGVNIASRIESLAMAGSVFISEKVYDEIKNQPDIQVQSMGTFELKNVRKPMEVFTISNQGLVVPQPDKIHGKTRRVSAATAPIEEVSIFRHFWKRGLILMIVSYVAGAWMLLQLVEWLLNRYQISPHWTNILLVFLISMVPSLILYVWNRKIIGQGRLSLTEKIAFPSNLLVSILLMSFMFKGIDLGATNKMVSTVNENGVTQQRLVVKPEFRKKIAIFFFSPEQEDSTQQWMRSGICGALAEDLRQNGYMKVSNWSQGSSLQEKISLAKNDFYDYILSGSYKIEKDSFVITTELHQTQSGRLKKKHIFRSNNFLTLIDTISTVTKRDLNLTTEQLEQFVDLPFAEGFTSNLEAYKYYSMYFLRNQFRYLEQAVIIDSTFAYANYLRALFQFNWSTGGFDADAAINQGMRHRKRLPESLEIKLRTLHFQISNQPDKAIALLQMQLDLDPGNPDVLETLISYFYLSEQYDELLSWRTKLATLDPNDPDLTLAVADAMMANEKLKPAGQLIEEVLARHPDHMNAIGLQTLFYAISRETKKADSLLQVLIILDPEIQPLAKEYSKAFQYFKKHPVEHQSLQKYTGTYRLQNRPAEFDVRIINNLPFIKGRTQRKGFFQLPSGPDEFTLGDESFMERWKYVKDTLGRVYKIDIIHTERDQRTDEAVLWRQDSLIIKAQALLTLDQQTEALEAFRTAYQHHPQHFYLSHYIEHLEFVLDPANQNLLNKMSRFVGQYGPRKIWLEDDRFFYQRDGQMSKTQLLPFSQDSFYFPGNYVYFMQVVVENGLVKGTITWEYKPATGNFERNDNDFIALESNISN